MRIEFESDTEKYEYFLRSAASVFSIFLIQAAETGIAIHNRLTGTAAEQAVIGGVFGLYAASAVYSAIQIKAHNLSRSARFVAFSETAGIWLAVASSLQAAISLGNQKFADGLIEGGFLALALLLFSAAKITRCLSNNAETQVSLWKIFSNKAGHKNIASTAGGVFGQGGALCGLSIYAFKRNEYGTFGGELFVTTYSISIAARMIYDWYQNKEDNTLFPWKKFLMNALFTASLIFLTGALISYVNKRSKTQCIQEGLSGSALLLAGIIFVGINKLQTYCAEKEEAENNCRLV